MLVNAPILHPIAARAGDVLAWYPARRIAVLRDDGRTCLVVRALPFDNAGALAGLLADGIIEPYDDVAALALRQRLPAWRVQPSPAPVVQEDALRTEPVPRSA
jgi:hypothetical protein